MNAKLSINSLRVNDGTISDSEVPLFVGLSKVVDKVNGRTMKMAVSLDRDWMWLRFADTPSQQYRNALVNWGFRFSGKRLGWGCEATEFIVNKVRGLGALTVVYTPLAQTRPSTPKVAAILEPVDMDVYPPKPTRNGKVNQNRKSPRQVQTTTAMVATNTVKPTHDSEGQILEFEVDQPQPSTTQTVQPTISNEQSNLEATVAEQSKQIAQLIALVAQLTAK